MTVVLRVRPDVRFVPIRGNVPTRIARVEEGVVDAVVLANAGLRRLGLDTHISEVFEPEVCLPAAGQGALGITIREGDVEADKMVATLRNVRAAACTTAERAALHTLGAGCHTPMGALAVVDDGVLKLRVRLCSADGAHVMEATAEGGIADAMRIGNEAAELLRARGAETLL